MKRAVDWVVRGGPSLARGGYNCSEANGEYIMAAGYRGGVKNSSSIYFRFLKEPMYQY